MHFTSPQREYDDVETDDFEDENTEVIADVEPEDIPLDEIDSTLKNVFTHIHTHGHDEDFSPQTIGEPTDTLPGTDSKIEELRRRVQLGLDLWHPDDRLNVAGDTISAIWPKPKATVASAEGVVEENVLMLRQQPLSSLLQPTKKPSIQKELPKPRQPKPEFRSSNSNGAQQPSADSSPSVVTGNPNLATTEVMAEVSTTIPQPQSSNTHQTFNDIGEEFDLTTQEACRAAGYTSIESIKSSSRNAVQVALSTYLNSGQLATLLDRCFGYVNVQLAETIEVKGSPAELTAEQMSKINALFAEIVPDFGKRCNTSGLRDFNAIMSGEALQGAYHFSLITLDQYHQMLERIADTLLKH